MRSSMTKPSIEVLRRYAVETGYTNFDCERFYDYWEMRGWLVRPGIPMRDWKAAVRTWRKFQDSWNVDKAQPQEETDPAILDYARQARTIIVEHKGYEIGRFWEKVKNAIGFDGYQRVRAQVDRLLHK